MQAKICYQNVQIAAAHKMHTGAKSLLLLRSVYIIITQQEYTAVLLTVMHPHSLRTLCHV